MLTEIIGIQKLKRIILMLMDTPIENINNIIRN